MKIVHSTFRKIRDTFGQYTCSSETVIKNVIGKTPWYFECNGKWPRLLVMIQLCNCPAWNCSKIVFIVGSSACNAFTKNILSAVLQTIYMDYKISSKVCLSHRSFTSFFGVIFIWHQNYFLYLFIMYYFFTHFCLPTNVWKRFFCISNFSCVWITGTNWYHMYIDFIFIQTRSMSFFCTSYIFSCQLYIF